MKYTTFISKRKAEEFHFPACKNERVLISCTTPGFKLAKLHDDTWKDVLRLQFHDVDPTHMNRDEALGYVLFDPELAVEVLKFLKKHQADTHDVIVHCEAGISRSAGIAKFIAHIYNLQFPENYMVYNKHVFSTLLRVYGESFYQSGLLPADQLPGIGEAP